MAMSKDIRVILIKIADRLHNTRTLQHQTPAKQISKSMETMEIYAPLAHRLGMQKIKWELEDVSLQYLDPEGYQQIIDYLHENEASAQNFMNAIQSKITDRLASVGIHGSIYGGVKHTYSIYRKMRAQNKTIDELYDLYAFRVIVDNIADCYNVLGHIHDLFNPIPGRFKDYISTRSPTCISRSTQPSSARRASPSRCRSAPGRCTRRRNTASRRTGNTSRTSARARKRNSSGSSRLLENQQDTEADDYIHSLKVDMFDDEVFVFTPKGKVMSLPSGSTPIDFRLRDSLRRRQHHDRREGQQPHRKLRSGAAQRRHCRGADVEIGKGTEPRLAQHLPVRIRRASRSSSGSSAKSATRISSAARQALNPSCAASASTPRSFSPRSAAAGSQESQLRLSGRYVRCHRLRRSDCHQGGRQNPRRADEGDEGGNAEGAFELKQAAACRQCLGRHCRGHRLVHDQVQPLLHTGAG